MWLLKDSDGKIYYLKTNKTCNIGRKQADIILDNDLSISRSHATLEVSLKEEVKKNELLTNCVVKDANSKYGTYIVRDGVQIKVVNQGHSLQPGDTVKFGLQHHTFKVEYISFMTTISRLSDEHKKQLKDIMDRIGGIVVNNYNNSCTHLTATTPTTTNKVISALVAGLPIVNINYWVSLEKAVDANNELPDPKMFSLSLQDKGINTQKVSLKPNPARQTIFKKKTFVFFSEKSYKTYKNMIEAAGGKTKLCNEDSKIALDNFFIDDHIIIQFAEKNDSNEVSNFYTLVCTKLQEKKLRMIAETEIPLAIIYVSLEQYCNPKFQFKKLIQRRSQVDDTSKVLALDTQDILPESNIKVENAKKMCIAESDLSYPSSSLQNYDSESMSSLESKNNLSSFKIQQKKSEIFNKNLDETKSISLKSDKLEKEKKETFPFKNSMGKIVSKTTKNTEVSENSREKNGNIHSDDLQNEKSLFLHSKKRKSADDTEKNAFKKKQKKDLEDVNEIKSQWKGTNKNRNIGISDEENDDEENLIPEKEKIEMKKKFQPNQPSISKFGFKKSGKEVVEFDLDDLDDIKPIKIHAKSKKSPEKICQQAEKLPSVQKHKIHGNVAKKSFVKETVKEDKAAWVFPEVSENKEEAKCKSEKLSFLRDLKKIDPDLDFKKNSKVFKKASYIVPDTRISFASMKIST